MANEEYLEMIELPVSSCEMVVLPKRKRFKKSKLVKSVNKKIDKAEKTKVEEPLPTESEIKTENEPTDIVLYEKKEKKKFRFDIVAAQVAAVFALIVAIILTNVFWEDSGINTLIKSVFHTETTTTDDRSFTAFKPVLPCAAEKLSVENGVMTVGGGSAVYSPAEGVVADVYEADGVYTVTVKHSDKFKSVISGLTSAYAEKGDKVYNGIPVGYISDSECKVAMYENDVLLTGYALEGGAIVWEN